MSEVKQISFVGLDRAGKTVLSNYFVTGEINPNFTPTLSINYSLLILNNIKYSIADLPGQKKLRRMWMKACDTAKCIIFMLDTSDAVRFPESDHEFANILKNLSDHSIPLYFLYHKIDLPKAQKNFPEAKMFFNQEYFSDMGFDNVKFFKTSIYEVETLNEVIKDFTRCIASEVAACEDI
jgi:small GTP-binding protein